MSTSEKHPAKKARSPRKTAQGGEPRKGSNARSARLETRITPENLKVIRRAAEIQGRSVSDFVASAAQEVAERAIERTQIIRLSVEDQRRFAESILKPPEPTEALRRAFESHRRLISAPDG